MGIHQRYIYIYFFGVKIQIWGSFKITCKIIGSIGEGAGWDICEYNAHKYAETTQVSKIIEMRGWCKENLTRIL